MATQRINPPFVGDERQILAGFLDFHRATMAQKCDDLTPDQLKQQASPPSNLSLLGLIRHLAEVEREWFLRYLTKEEALCIWNSDEKPDADFAEAPSADVAEAFAEWNEHCERSRAALASVASLDQTFILEGLGDISVRWLLVHMVEEYARHVGHADLLRERIDGVTGV